MMRAKEQVAAWRPSEPAGEAAGSCRMISATRPATLLAHGPSHGLSWTKASDVGELGPGHGSHSYAGSSLSMVSTSIPEQAQAGVMTQCHPEQYLSCQGQDEKSSMAWKFDASVSWALMKAHLEQGRLKGSHPPRSGLLLHIVWIRDRAECC